jgi:hypothetical protein
MNQKCRANHTSGNSTIASPVATLSPLWFFTMTSISAQREFAVACFDLTIAVGWMVSPGLTGLTTLFRAGASLAAPAPADLSRTDAV